MKQRIVWMAALLLMTAAAVWLVLDSTRHEGAPAPAPPATSATAAADRTASEPPAAGRAAVAEEVATSPSQETPARAEESIVSPPPFRSPMALDLDNVAGSFLSSQPAVNELLDQVEQLASIATIDEDSLMIQRGPDGELLSARGALAVGDVPGTFQIDQDGFRVEFRSAIDGPAWSRRDLLISFQEGESGARGCHATVQFHARQGEPDPGLPHGAEKLVGWSVGTDPKNGSLARPIRLVSQGGAWAIADSEREVPQEFPWLTSCSGFDAWLRLLQPIGALPAR